MMRLPGAIAAAALALLCACGPAGELAGGPGLPGGPTPPPRGHPSGLPTSLVVGPDGGTVSQSSLLDGGSISVVVPPGALAAPTDVTITELSGNPPAGAVGSVWQIGPPAAPLALPVTLTLTPPPPALAKDLTLANQGPTGYWFRTYAVTREAVLNTVSLQTQSLGSWALVSIAAQQDLSGPIRLDSTQDRFTATGNVTLQFLGVGAPFDLYAVTGTIQAVAPIPNDGTLPSCTVHEATTPSLQSMPPSIAELQETVKFRWGINGRWDLDCANGTHPFISTNFDSLGLTNIGCDRHYAWPPGAPALPAPLFTPAHVQGQYVIDCLAAGKVTASWDLVQPPLVPGPLPLP